MESLEIIQQKRLALSIAEISEACGVSVPFVRLEIRRGKLRALKLGRRLVVPIEALREWLDAGMTKEG